MKRFALTKANGEVLVMTGNDNIDPAVEMAKWHPNLRARQNVQAVVEITTDDIPVSRKLRKAWVFQNGKIEVDIGKGRIERKRQLEEELGRNLTGPETAELNSRNTAEDIENYQP